MPARVLYDVSVATTPTDLDALLTSEEVAEKLRSTPRFVRRLVAERRIAYIKSGRKVLFEPAAVAAYLNANRVTPMTRSERAAAFWTAA